jgi:hypothetical protein
MEVILNYIISPPLSGWLLFLKIIFIAFSLALIGFFIFVAFSTTWLKRFILWDVQEIMTYRPFGVRRIVKQWRKIKARLDTGLESEYKLAIIEADSMLDDILRRMGFAGASLGERLDKLTLASLPNLEETRKAHQIRNNIVHDPDYRLSLDESKSTLAIYEKALENLQAL